MTSLIVTLLFLQVSRPKHDPKFAVRYASAASPCGRGDLGGWLPWIVVSVTVIVWTSFRVFLIGDLKILWPGLHNAVSITLYNNTPYAAAWDFQPLGTGTAILLAAIITAALVRLPVYAFLACVADTWRQIWIAIVTVMLIIGLAYLMNYSGLNYTLGWGVASVGPLFALVSPFLGWVAVFLSGSDTSGNALFGNLQVVAARQLDLNPVLFAATNFSGGVMGKMISPQNIATGVSVTDLRGTGGRGVCAHLQAQHFPDFRLGALVVTQQHLIPGVIPH
jgi:lactate permease